MKKRIRINVASNLDLDTCLPEGHHDLLMETLNRRVDEMIEDVLRSYMAFLGIEAEVVKDPEEPEISDRTGEPEVGSVTGKEPCG